MVRTSQEGELTHRKCPPNRFVASRRNVLEQGSLLRPIRSPKEARRGVIEAERSAVTRELSIRYLKATKAGRGVILTELCELTGWSRWHARRRLGQVPLAGPMPARLRRIRQRTYDDEVITQLTRIWKMLGAPCGKRLAPFVSEFVSVLKHHREIRLTPEIRDKLCAMSPATIDRALARPA